MWLTRHTAGQFWIALNEKLQRIRLSSENRAVIVPPPALGNGAAFALKMRPTTTPSASTSKSSSLHSPDDRLADARFRIKHVLAGFYHRHFSLPQSSRFHASRPVTTQGEVATWVSPVRASSTRHRSDCGMHRQWQHLGSRIECRMA
jgi:hypothetical protein